MISYLIVLATMVSGAAHAPVWSSLVGGVTLGVLSLAEKRHLRSSLAANDNLVLLNPASISAAFLHCTLGACAYPIGYAIRAVGP